MQFKIVDPVISWPQSWEIFGRVGGNECPTVVVLPQVRGVTQNWKTEQAS